MTDRIQELTRLGLVIALVASGCGAGVAGVAAGTGAGGGSSSPAITTFALDSQKSPPARIKITATRATRVQLQFERPGQPALPLRSIRANPVELEGNVEQTLEWEFSADLNEPDAGFVPGVTVFAAFEGRTERLAQISAGLGNDAPEITIEDPPSEVVGVVPIRLALSDSSSDVVSIRAEYQLVSEPADVWHPARPAGLRPSDPNPDPTLVGQEAPAAGRELLFFWDTDSDLADLERDVRLRFTPDDGTLDSGGNQVGVGTPRVSGLFRVDNNAAPIVQLDSGPLIVNPDDLGGIPIPFRVVDEEGDLVEVIFQWRREGEPFPELPTADRAALDALLADPAQHREKHVCAPYPHYAKGRVIPIGASTVRLSELASSESWVAANGLDGKTLEFLRPSSIPEPITETWSSNPLVGPIAALPVDDGLTALVLDSPSGSWRLREIELATGRVLPEPDSILASGPGLPSAMCLERGEQFVLVASDLAGLWRLERVECATGTHSELVASDGSEPAPVRGMTSLGTRAVAFTAGSTLFHLDYWDESAPQLGRLLEELATPWGLVADPQSPSSLYLSEHGANRVLRIELGARARLPLVVKNADRQAEFLQSPKALALERKGSRLLIITNRPGTGDQLVGLDLGARDGNVAFPIGGPLTATCQGMASGPDGLRLLCTSSALLAAGGVQQRRTITAYSTSSQDVSVGIPFDPLPARGLPWRITEGRLRASAQGAESRFVWNTEEVYSGSVFLRAMARDEEVGLPAQGSAPKAVRSPHAGEPLDLGDGSTTPFFVTVADLDGDGALDLATTNFSSDNLSIFYQSAPGAFDSPQFTLGDSATTAAPRSVAAADLDGDGDVDLVSANSGLDSLGVFFQQAQGGFATPPIQLGDSATTIRPFAVAAADLDGDGDQDLVSANQQGDGLTVFFQEAPGLFATPPLALDTGGSTSVVTQDLDSDGDLDLAAAGGHGLTVYFQDGRGTFDPSPLVLSAGNSPGFVAAADLDGDGDFDLVDDDLSIFFQRDPGSFEHAITLNDDVLDNKRVVPVDINGDRALDLLASRFGLGLTAFLQSAPGSFGLTPVGQIGDPLAGLGSVADLNGDAEPDLIATRGGGLRVFLRARPGTFSAPPLALGGIPFFGLTSIAYADLDNDGDLDLAAAYLSSHNLTVFFQNAPGSFDPAPLVLGGLPTTAGPRSVAAADLDGDGDQDLVSANLSGRNLTVFFQVAPGSFDPTPLVLGNDFTTEDPCCVIAGDLDRDGAQDIVSANAETVTVFFQRNGRFTRAPSLTIDPPSGSGFVVAADLDGDGREDLITGGINRLAVFFQGPVRRFESPPLLLGDSMGIVFSAAATDIDADGDLDLVSVSAISTTRSSLSIFFQVGPGVFDPTPLVLDFSNGGFGNPQSLAVEDLDGDGDPDLVASGLIAFFQRAPGAFDPAPVELGRLPIGLNELVRAIDLDGDGDQDLLRSSRDSLIVHWGGR